MYYRNYNEALAWTNLRGWYRSLACVLQAEGVGTVFCYSRALEAPPEAGVQG